ncbi:MAG: peptidase and D,D-carboxypeptidase VanY/endolysin [Collimonas fungivorans]|uniref:M15 family metallopeptidase n=1 Tax=Collimonas fungivorans TaxID=158899 RepID=UPI0026ED8DFB|nr:M15 family metallopeptidase [Collimonas fungivorans]MDB5766626.1 peptidase and D,D-carboxypeptidase VanY/endolysin [Collimonas fungivorans]
MFVLVIALYFLLACGVAGLLLFPAAREIVYLALIKRRQQMGAQVQNWRDRRSQTTRSLSQNLQASRLSSWQFIKRHQWILLAGMAVVLIPPLIAWLLSGKTMLGSYDDSGQVVNQQIAALLEGEQLVPPPPLPPEVFTTQEVAQVRPMLDTASRNWQALDADFTQRLLMTFKIMKEKYGYDMVIIEGYRSPERQNALAQMGGSVTNAKAFQSYHQYGLAADSAFMRSGKLVITEKDPWAMRGYQLYGEVAESVGLTWGGRWKMMDLGHVEFRKPGVMKR